VTEVTQVLANDATTIVEIEDHDQDIIIIIITIMIMDIIIILFFHHYFYLIDLIDLFIGKKLDSFFYILNNYKTTKHGIYEFNY
jgi:hypothetical protein